MAEITLEARSILKGAFEEVAYRANRLREWIVYQEKLRPLQISFGVLLAEVEVGIGSNGFNDGAFPRIKNSWASCKGSDLLDLQIFHEEVVRYIDKPLNAAAVPPAKVKYDVANFLMLRASIDQDVGKLRGAELKDHCSNFEDAIKFQLAILRNTVQTEMQELCDLTRKLYVDFGATS
jgi:hypothetical protein